MSGPDKAGPDELVLYFHFGSFYSQKARMALIEKGLSFKEHMVNIEVDEQLSLWYMKIHPEGKVPTLQHGDKFIPDSAKIIEYLDKTFGAPLLQPDRSTDYGKKVAHFQERLDSIIIDVLTFGTTFYKDDLGVDCIVPEMHRQRFKRYVTTGPKEMQRLKEAHPELKDEFESKVQAYNVRADALKDKAGLLKQLELSKDILKEVEKQLEETEKACGKKDTWLCGEDFTVADLILVLTLNRLYGLGHIKPLLSEGKMPRLGAYLQRMQKRPSFQEVCQDPRMMAQLQKK